MDLHGANRRAVAERLAEAWARVDGITADDAVLLLEPGHLADATRGFLGALAGLRKGCAPAPETWRLTCYIIRNSATIARKRRA